MSTLQNVEQHKRMPNNRLYYLALLSILTLMLVSSDCLAGKKREWQAEDSFKMKYIGELSVSPDDELLLFRVSTADLKENRYYSSIWVVPTKGGEPTPLTDIKGSVSSPRWSPDGSMIAFFSSDEDGLGLWAMNKDASGKRKLTALERSNVYLGWGDNVGNDLTWSPDGRKLAYTAAGPRHYSNDPSPQNPPNGNDVMVVDRLLFKGIYYYSDLRRTYVWVISVDGGVPEQISFGEYDYHSISWSPDGKRIASVSNRTGKDDFNANTDICLLSPIGEDLIQLTQTVGPEYQPIWSPDGSWIAYLGRMRDHRSKESDAELKKVFVIPVGSGSPVDLTARLDRWSYPP
ncbi:MAG: DPP IV N-terminal domain-containing protein, partial [Ignavibacteria bacterium]|nr:DPP IV N-terminal domain-containing protein [Ignavibacteria bacterium]